MEIVTVGNMYPPHHLGGYELMWRSAVSHLRASGHRVRVLTTTHRIANPDTALASDPEVHRQLDWYWRAHKWPRLSVLERWQLERANLTILEHHLADVRPDLVIWWAMGGMSLSLIQRTCDRAVPGLGVVHDDWLLYGPEVDQWQRGARRIGPARRALEIFTGIPSRLHFDDQLEWLGVSELTLGRARSGGWALRRSDVAHSGVDPALFEQRPAAPWSGRLLCVGRLDPRKGAHTAIEAIAELPGTELRIVGTGDPAYERRLRDLISELALEDRVSLNPLPRERIPAAYETADAVIFPVQWEEPWGLVPLEAMAVGRPVIATGTGGSAEYLEDDRNCLLYAPADDSTALADAIRKLSRDEGLRARLRHGGLQTASRIDLNAFYVGLDAAIGRAVKAGSTAMMKS